MFSTNKYMQHALNLAENAFNANEVPVGAVIVDGNGDIISGSFNLVETEGNPLFHAELKAIESACQKLQSKTLAGCSMYVTLEPCYMCAGAISLAKISKLYIGVEDKRFGAVLNGLKLYINGNLNHKPEVYTDIMPTECGDILNKFFQQLRC